ncbi:MAG: DegV family protein [Clostridiales bacterium]|nr:DegV family protein [Clostridiales bacterium]
MNQNKIAVMVDSCTDVSEELLKEMGIYSVPIIIIYKDGEYRDKIDISSQEVYDRLPLETPRTSLPSGESISNAFNQIKQDGYEKLIIVSISSALSGTYNMMNIMADEFTDLEIKVIDTKSISYGAGSQAVLAAKLAQEGMGFEEIIQKVQNSIIDSKIYFCLSTLEYLARGGRIGKVSAVLGSLLKIKPIITCNDEGAYTIAAKVRGRAQAIAETVNFAVREAGKHVACNIAVIEGNAKEEAARVLEEVKRRIPNCKSFQEQTVGPALVVHTGPGLLGINVQALTIA